MPVKKRNLVKRAHKKFVNRLSTPSRGNILITPQIPDKPGNLKMTTKKGNQTVRNVVSKQLMNIKKLKQRKYSRTKKMRGNNATRVQAYTRIL